MMKKKKLFIWIISLSMVLCFSGFAYALFGGPQDPIDCSNIPEPANRGPFIWGEFTVSQIPACLVGASERSVVHVTLRRFGEVHLYNILLDQASLCTLDEDALMEVVAQWACKLHVGEDFGINGYPVVKNINIRQMELCGDPDEMIRGTILIRVVPQPAQ